MQRTRTTFLSVAALALGLSGPALAESSFTSSISGGQDGFLSRIWYDNNYDNVATTIYFGGCDRDNQAVAIYQQVSGIDPNMGSRTLCSSRTGNWGDMPRDDYRFKLLGGTDIDINTVTVRY